MITAGAGITGELTTLGFMAAGAGTTGVGDDLGAGTVGAGDMATSIIGQYGAILEVHQSLLGAGVGTTGAGMLAGVGTLAGAGIIIGAGEMATETIQLPLMEDAEVLYFIIITV